MTRNEQGIPIHVLRELISLDADTGILTWKQRLAHHHKPTAKRTAEHIAANWNSLYEGKPALACVDASGHLHGRIFNKRIYAHRAVFALVNGDWPEYAHLGFFEHKEEAIARRLAANSGIGFHENHGAARQ